MKYVLYLFSLVRSIIFNFLHLNFFDAIRLPFWIYYNVRTDVKGRIEIHNEAKRMFAIRIGSGGSSHIIPNAYTYFKVGKNSKIVFMGKAGIAMGSSIRVDKSGELIIGENFSCNRNCNISCSNRIVFGRNNLLGWNIFVRDTDGHDIFQNGSLKVASKEVVFGDHVWCCSFADVLKGVKIPSGSIVAWRACVVKPFSEENILIAGFPATIIKHNITWDL